MTDDRLPDGLQLVDDPDADDLHCYSSAELELALAEIWAFADEAPDEAFSAGAKEAAEMFHELLVNGWIDRLVPDEHAEQR